MISISVENVLFPFKYYRTVHMLLEIMFEMAPVEIGVAL